MATKKSNEVVSAHVEVNFADGSSVLSDLDADGAIELLRKLKDVEAKKDKARRSTKRRDIAAFDLYEAGYGIATIARTLGVSQLAAQSAIRRVECGRYGTIGEDEG